MTKEQDARSDHKYARRPWVDVLGAIGLIASLVFVALEIRQNTVATRAGTAQAVFEENTSWAAELLQNRPAMEVLSVAFANPDTVEALEGTVESLMLSLLMSSQFSYYQNLWYQAKTGALDEEAWTVQLELLRAGAEAEEGGWRLHTYYWSRSRNRYLPGFRAVMDEVFGKGP